MNLQDKLNEIRKSANEEANKKWEDDKKYTVQILSQEEIKKIAKYTNLDGDTDNIIIDLSVGQWDTQAFYTIEVTHNNWSIIQSSGSNPNIDDIMNYLICPTLWNSTQEIAGGIE